MSRAYVSELSPVDRIVKYASRYHVKYSYRRWPTVRDAVHACKLRMSQIKLAADSGKFELVMTPEAKRGGLGPQLVVVKGLKEVQNERS